MGPRTFLTVQRVSCIIVLQFVGCLLGSSMVELMVTSSMRAYATHYMTQVYCSQSPRPCSRLLLTRTSTGDSNTGLALSLWGLWILVHTKFCLSLQASLPGMGLDCKHDFTPPTIFLGLLLCPWTWGIFFWCDPTFCQWLFSSKLMSTSPSTPPSCQEHQRQSE